MRKINGVFQLFEQFTCQHKLHYRGRSGRKTAIYGCPGLPETGWLPGKQYLESPVTAIWIPPVSIILHIKILVLSILIHWVRAISYWDTIPLEESHLLGFLSEWVQRLWTTANNEEGICLLNQQIRFWRGDEIGDVAALRCRFLYDWEMCANLDINLFIDPWVNWDTGYSWLKIL